MDLNVESFAPYPPVELINKVVSFFFFFFFWSVKLLELSIFNRGVFILINSLTN